MGHSLVEEMDPVGDKVVVVVKATGEDVVMMVSVLPRVGLIAWDADLEIVPDKLIVDTV